MWAIVVAGAWRRKVAGRVAIRAGGNEGCRDRRAAAALPIDLGGTGIVEGIAATGPMHACLPGRACEAAFPAMMRISQQVRAIVATDRRSRVADTDSILAFRVRVARVSARSAIRLVTREIDAVASTRRLPAAALLVTGRWSSSRRRTPCSHTGAIATRTAWARRAIVERGTDPLPAQIVLATFAAFLLHALLANAATDATKATFAPCRLPQGDSQTGPKWE